jgi:hypothetical protein
VKRLIVIMIIIITTGVYTWPDGRRYEGEFKEGVSDGRGARSERIGGENPFV